MIDFSIPSGATGARLKKIANGDWYLMFDRSEGSEAPGPPEVFIILASEAVNPAGDRHLNQLSDAEVEELIEDLLRVKGATPTVASDPDLEIIAAWSLG